VDGGLEGFLSVDADERVTPELAREIQAAIQRDAAEGYAVPRRSKFLGQWITASGWYPDYQIRLFRKGKGWFQTEKRVHEGVVLKGRVVRLTGDLLHEPYRDVAHYFRKFNEYTTLAAQDLRDRGTVFRVGHLFTRPAAAWVKSFILQRGWRDGVAGFVIAQLAAFNTFVKYAKLWELQQPRTQVRESGNT